MRSGVHVIALVGSLVSLCAVAEAHDWGPLNGCVVPTTPGTQNALLMLESAAASYGMTTLGVGGQAGSTTLGGIPTNQFDSESDGININFDGIATWNSVEGGAIALNAASWTDANLQPPIDLHLVAMYLFLSYHEAAHLAYAPYFSSWCTGNPVSCSDFSSCIESLVDEDGESKGYSSDKNNPCNEAFSWDSTALRLSLNKLQVCENGDPSQAKKDAMIAQLDSAIAAANARCEENRADCVACGGPPMPSGFNNCNPAGCDCPEEE